MSQAATKSDSMLVRTAVCPECGTRADAPPKQAIRMLCSKWAASIVLLLGVAAFLTATVMTSKFDSGHMQGCSSPNIDELKVRVDDLRQYAISDNPLDDLIRGVVEQIQSRGGQPLDPYMVDMDLGLKVSASFGGSQYALPSRASESIGWPVGAVWKTSRDPSSSANTFPSPGELVIGPFEISFHRLNFAAQAFHVELSFGALAFVLSIFVVTDIVDGWLDRFAASGLRAPHKPKQRRSRLIARRRRGRLACHAAVGVFIALQFVVSYQQSVMLGTSGSSWSTSNYGVSTLRESDFRDATRLDDPQWRRDVYAAMLKALPQSAHGEIVRLAWERNVQIKPGRTLLSGWPYGYFFSYQITELPAPSSASTDVQVDWHAASMRGPLGSARARWIDMYVNLTIVVEIFFALWLLFQLTRLLQWLIVRRRVTRRLSKGLCIACGYPLPKPRDVAVVAT